jgi:hypothetical protein
MADVGSTAQYVEVLHIIRELNLEFPVATQEQFVDRIAESRDTIVFRGVPYDAAFAARLLPPFYFPIHSEEDLLAKAIELMIARGLIPFLPQ